MGSFGKRAMELYVWVFAVRIEMPKADIAKRR